MLTLHVTNGDHAAQGLSRSGLSGDVLAWRDVLHDGPVLTDESSDAFRATRARFIADRGWSNAEAVERDFVERDERLAGLAPGDAIVLWFEPDLYDQLQLMQVLHRLSLLDPAARPQLCIAPADFMLGTLKPEHFCPAYEQRRAITDDDLVIGREAWRAFTASAPDAMSEMITQLERRVPARTYAADDAVRLPHLLAALRRLLEEFPEKESGLSRTERQLCEVLMVGPSPVNDVYTKAHHGSESWAWLGDSSFAWYLERLGEGVHPVVSNANGTRILAPRSERDGRTFWERPVMLTPFGKQLMRGQANAIASNGIDRWIGGVHLTTDAHWLWDSRTQRVMAASA